MDRSQRSRAQWYSQTAAPREETDLWLPTRAEPKERIALAKDGKRKNAGQEDMLPVRRFCIGNSRRTTLK